MVLGSRELGTARGLEKLATHPCKEWETQDAEWNNIPGMPYSQKVLAHKQRQRQLEILSVLQEMPWDGSEGFIWSLT